MIGLLAQARWSVFGPPDHELVGRVSGWRELSREWLVANPSCAMCGARKFLIAHHIWPVSWRPELELDWKNLITLCEGRPTLNCHLWGGHCGDYRSRRPDVIDFTTDFLYEINHRRYPEAA